MRYSIVNGQIVESFLIDAPYDTRSDARHDLERGVFRYTATCDFPADERGEPCPLCLTCRSFHDQHDTPDECYSCTEARVESEWDDASDDAFYSAGPDLDTVNE